jgi:hypothetical protein
MLRGVFWGINTFDLDMRVKCKHGIDSVKCTRPPPRHIEARSVRFITADVWMWTAFEGGVRIQGTHYHRCFQLAQEALLPGTNMEQV